MSYKQLMRVVSTIIGFRGTLGLAFLICTAFSAVGRAAELTALEQLGKQIFFDTNLSSPAGQSCASCHSPETGFSGSNSQINLATGIYPGAVVGRFGNRKPQTVAYASFSPKRNYEAADETYVGGQFWDGRADDLTEQAKGPFLNPLEMNNASAADVVHKIRMASYQSLFEQVYGVSSLRNPNSDAVFDQIARAIAAYETSCEVNAFSSKYDWYLAGQGKLNSAEQRGLELFAGKANCTACHPHERNLDGSPPLFTDFTYDNVGAPRNTNNPFYRAPAQTNSDGPRYRDLGLGGELKVQTHWGKVKVPTLRNVAKRPTASFVKAYLHNGSMKSLKDVVRFYNRRDLTPREFAAPDVAENVNRDELGNLGLTDAEEDDLVAFLETLSDGYLPTERPSRTTPVSSTDRFRSAREIFRVTRFREAEIHSASRSDLLRR